MTTFIRSKVSKQKRRFVEDGFDLDLSYVTNQIIAMGFPSEDNERFYRNPYTEVIRFLNHYHKDKFKIYNLCSERGYDPAKFYGRAARYPFDDHNAPPFEVIEEMCVDVKEFLSQGEDHVAVIHCKAGKGRTGLMICCWLLFNGEWETADKAQAYYAAMRTKNQKGVTIPSQIRYINYFEKRMRMGQWNPEYKSIPLKSIVLNGIPKIQGEIKLTIFMDKEPYRPWKPTEAEQANFKKRKGQAIGKKGLQKYVIDCGGFDVIRDVKVQFEEQKLSKKEILFTFWFNTYFIGNEPVLHLEQPECDRANKDKGNKVFPVGFSVDVYFGNENPPVIFEDEDQSLERGGEEEDDHTPKIGEALNDRSGPWNKPSRNPCDVVINLLDMAINVYISNLPVGETRVVSKYVPKVVGDGGETGGKFGEFEAATAELQRAILDGLSENELLLFWINMVNLMYLHAFLTFGACNNVSLREKILVNACYNIGGILYPLVFVEHVMIGGNLRGCFEMNGLKIPKAKVKEKDPRKNYMLRNPPNLVHFAISGGATCLPPLVVFRSPHTICDDLLGVAKVALRNIVSVQGKISLPAYLSWCRKDFGKKECDAIEAFLNIAGQQVMGYSRILYSDTDWEFGYIFYHHVHRISLGEAMAIVDEQEKGKPLNEKEQRKANLLSLMDDIDDEESQNKKAKGFFSSGKKKDQKTSTNLLGTARNSYISDRSPLESGLSSSNSSSSFTTSTPTSTGPGPAQPPPAFVPHHPQQLQQQQSQGGNCDVCGVSATVFLSKL